MSAGALRGPYFFILTIRTLTVEILTNQQYYIPKALYWKLTIEFRRMY